MVVWIVGMHAAGKSLVAHKIKDLLHNKGFQPILIDGGKLRSLLGDEVGYSLENRKKHSMTISRVCKFLADQNFIVICAILSVCEKSRKWNRDNIPNYFEIFIDVPIEILKVRDERNLYKLALAGDLDDFVGVDICFEPPQTYDLKINNSADLAYLDQQVDCVMDKLSDLLPFQIRS